MRQHHVSCCLYSRVVPEAKWYWQADSVSDQNYIEATITKSVCEVRQRKTCYKTLPSSFEFIVDLNLYRPHSVLNVHLYIFCQF